MNAPAQGQRAKVPRRGRRGHGGAQRDRLLQATEALLLASGDLAAVSVTAICAAAGCTAPTLYFHFGTKDALVLAVTERHFRALAELMDAAAGTAADPVEALHARGEAYIRFGLGSPEHYRILFLAPHGRQPPQAPAPAVGDVIGFSALVQDVAAAQQSGLVPAGRSAVSVSLQLWAAVHGLTALLITAPTAPWGDLDQLISDYLGAVVRAIQLDADAAGGKW